MKIKKSRTKGDNKVKLPTSALLLLFALLAALVTTQLVAMRAQSNEGKESKMGQGFPIVDYNAPAPSNGQARSMREARGRRYDGQKGFVEKSPTGDESLFIDDSMVSLPALPVDGIDAIVLAEVGDARAYLSNDKSGVYSEFAVRVERVFKDNREPPLSPGISITVDRMGGRVKHSPVRTKLYHVAGQNMPQVGRRYVFFLRRGPETDNYSIVTAYELASGRVHPLDGSNAKPPARWAGDIYENTDEGSFLNKLQETIAVATSSQRPATNPNP